MQLAFLRLRKQRVTSPPLLYPEKFCAFRHCLASPVSSHRTHTFSPSPHERHHAGHGHSARRRARRPARSRPTGLQGPPAQARHVGAFQGHRGARGGVGEPEGARRRPQHRHHRARRPRQDHPRRRDARAVQGLPREREGRDARHGQQRSRARARHHHPLQEHRGDVQGHQDQHHRHTGTR